MPYVRSAVSLALALSVIGCKSPGDAAVKEPRPVKPPEGFHPARVTPIDSALQANARNQLRSALRSGDELVRTHALEVVADVGLTDLAPQVLPSLDDPSPLVRKAAAISAGRLKLATAHDRLVQIVSGPAVIRNTSDPDQPTYVLQARIAAIFALHMLGDTRWTHELEQTAVDGRPQIRGDTALILEMIGNTSAEPMLYEMMKKDTVPNVRLQAAEALWQLGDARGEDTLIQATVSNFASDRMIAVLALAGPRDRKVLRNVYGLLTDDYPEVAIVAARAAGQLGNDAGIGVAEKGASSGDPMQRALAALALGDIGRPDSQSILSKLLDDDHADVRVTAAAALLEIGKKK